MRHELAVRARYTRWMNQRIYAVSATVPEAEIMQDRGAFFGAIFATLNHIVLADLLWMERFARADASDRELDPIRAMVEPTQLDQPMQSRRLATAGRALPCGIVAASCGLA